MDLETVLSAARTIFAALQCPELRQFCDVLGYKSQLENLESTIKMVKVVLEEAEHKPELTKRAQIYISRLRDAVYDADDLLDEFVTLARSKKKLIKGGKVTKKVGSLISSFNSLGFAYKMFQGVKEIRMRLDEIASDHIKFGFKLDSQPILRRREETCSYVYVEDIIGRAGDQEKIVGMLLNDDDGDHVSCLSIVGMGGLGKTTLAQLVFNDPRVKENFSLRLWACISDQDLEHLDVKATLCKILQSATGNSHENLTMEPLQEKLRGVIEGRKYLLVLDDLWNEDCLQWKELVKFLKMGLKGAWILVTTRSRDTAAIVAMRHIHELEGLSKDDSWRLFEATAFGQKGDQSHSSELMEIGRCIVEKCANVPLAIKVAGSLLYEQEKDKWLHFHKAELGRLKDGKRGGIGPILKLSYYHLDLPLKTCFAYCALFPRDHVVERKMLISLWMAQDYIMPREDQSIEDVGEEYFSILVKRCFFQNVTKDIHGKIVSCKIHGLMHDIAQEVAGKEIYATDAIKTDFDSRVRHLSYGYMYSDTRITYTKAKVRTCLRISQPWQKAIVDQLLRNWMCLRTLDLSKSIFESLPNDLVKLLHLRYLDLSYNVSLEVLPKPFSKLHNLQTLRLHGCYSLRELPKDLSELVNLRVLDVEGCNSLCSFPEGMGRLTCLQRLPLFLVGQRNSSSKSSVVNQMEELEALTNLKGKLRICLLPNFAYAKKNVKQGGYIRNKEHLNHLCISFLSWEYEATENEQLMLLEDLRPHCSLKELRLDHFGGTRMPSWAKDDKLATFLPNLVKLDLDDCTGLQYLPSLRKLRNLRSLVASCLCDLEYIENIGAGSIIGDATSTSESRILYPSLQQLTLRGLYKLKGWWRDDDDISDGGMHGGQRQLLTSFPSLSELTIYECPSFKCVITCPNVEELKLEGKLNDQLRILIPFDSTNPKLRKVCYRNAGALKLVSPIQAFQCLKEMEIAYADKMESFSEVGEVFRGSAFLREIKIWYCWKLKSLRGLEHLTAVKSLSLTGLGDLRSPCEGGDGEEEDDEMPWRCLQNLQSLSLELIRNMSKLPKGMRHLKALQHLHIRSCGLETLPEFMQELTSLTRLEIGNCPHGLKKRCQKNTGEDWPNIQHIPRIEFRNY